MQTYRSHSRSVNYIEFEGESVELLHEPYSDTLVKQVGDKLIVAYLVQDSNCDNPLESDCAQGVIYTRSRSRTNYITDNDSEFYAALGIDRYGSVDIDEPFPCTPYIDYKGIQQNKKSLRDRAADIWFAKIRADDELMARWLESQGADADTEITDDVLRDLQRNLEDCNGEFWEEIQDAAVELFPKYMHEIIGAYTVPIYINQERGGCNCGTTTWDGDTDDLPDGVWVADKDAIDNIGAYPPGVEVGQIKGDDEKYTSEYELTDKGVQVHRGSLGECWSWMKSNYTVTPDDLNRAVVKYADGSLKEYSAWASGEVYGCVTEVFELQEDSSWEQVEEDSCWCFVGIEYAEKTLKDEYFDNVVADYHSNYSTNNQELFDVTEGNAL